MPTRKSQKQDVEETEEETEEEPEQEEEGEEGEEFEQSGTSINISEDSISIEVPRDGNEANTISGLANLVEGLSQ